MHYLLAAGMLAMLLYFRFQSKALGLSLMAMAAFAAARGFIAVALPLSIIAVYLLRGSSFSQTAARSRPQNSQSDNPSVRSKFLQMELDQETGKLSGSIVKGLHSGLELSQLSLKQLLELLYAYHTSDGESEQLLIAYLDQAHPKWQDEIGSYTRRQSAGGSSSLSRNEALEILGLSSAATDSQIKAAHRRLIKKFHPDSGGSAHLAAIINQAKDTLLGQ